MGPAVGALIAFCLISSATDLLHDCRNLASDRAHPSKRKRQIASGRLNVATAMAVAALLAMVSLILAGWRPDG